jgi:hypothetical protein
MGFRINKGIFQFNDGRNWINKIKITEAGEFTEVDNDGNPLESYLRIGMKATDSDKIDGYHATNAGGGIPVLNSNGYWNSPNWINIYGHGLYSSSMNGAHFYPNNNGQYGSWKILGTRNGWYGLHFGEESGVTLMMNETESGIHRNGTGWKYRHQGGKFYVYTGTNGGGTGYPVWHEGNLTPISYSTGSFFVGGDPGTYYPVLLNKSSRTTGRFVIYRDNVHQDETNRGAGRLVLNGFTSGWGHVPLTLHYETKISGGVLWKFLASNYRTGLMVVYLKGATTYYYKSEHGFTLHDANGQGDAKSDGRTTWLPTRESEANAAWEGETPSVLTIEHGVSYYDGYVKAAGFKGDGANLTNVDAQTLDGIDSSGFLRSTAKAADSDKLDGIDSSSFLRSDATDTASSRIDFTADESIRLKGIRGQFTNEYMHLYNKVGIGHPNGWGQGEADTPDKGISTYGGANFAYGNNATSSFKGSLRVDVDWGANEYPEQFTVRGTYPSIALRSTTHNAKWLIHNDNNVSWYYGSAVDTDDWSLRFRIATNGNIWMQWAGGWLSDLLNAKETAGAANTVETALNTRIDEELRPAIDTAQSTADSAVTAAAAAQATADVAETRANGAKQASADALAAAEAAQTTADGKLGSSDKAANSHAADGVNMVGYGNNEFSFNQSSGTFAGYTGWANYFIGNHGSGSSYYNTTHIMPFWGPPQYSRLEGGTFRGPYTYWTTENFDPSTKASTGDVAGVDARITDEVLPQISTNADNIARNAADIATKAAAGGSYSQDFAADDMYVDQWFRNTASGKGLYNEATGQHFYSDDDDYWNVAGGTTANAIRFRDEHAGTIRGYIYADSGNNVGLLDSGGSWGVRHQNDSGTYFYTDNTTLEFSVGRDLVTGSYGTVQTSTTRGGWGGYSINGQYVFMSNHSSVVGIYNDIDNEWMITFDRNAGADIRYNGATRLQTTSGGVSVTGTVTATAFSGNGSGLTNLPIPDQSIPVTVNGAENTTLASMNINLDRGQIEFTLQNGGTFSAMLAR